jgi:hypothetical protein
MDARHRPFERRAGGRSAALAAAAALTAALTAAACGTTPPPAGEETACPLPAYPTAACTGVPAGTSLTTHQGDLVVTTPGQVVEGVRVTGGVDVRADGVVIRDAEVRGPVRNDFDGRRYRFTIEDSTVGTATGCSSWGNGAVGVSNYTARRVRVAGFPDGFRVAGSDTVIEHSMVTLCSSNPDDHSDGIQAYGAAGATNIVIDHNSIDQRAVTNGAATAPIFIPNDGERQGNRDLDVTVTDNLLAGGGFSLRVYGDLPFTAPAVTGNKIVDGTWAYGPLDVSCARIGAWSGNATVTYDWSTGRITGQARALDDCA